jgi:3-hydroxyacyl-[acyl-carrier-protein] dehydratase
MVPQRKPFRFIDEILEVSESLAVGRYTFRQDESFYAGHFPGDPITPGVILLETMGQTGVVALGIYLKSLEVDLEELRKWNSIFTDAEVEFYSIVRPGDRVTCRAEKIFWRRNKLKAKIEMFGEDGKIIARTIASGLGVRRE